MHKMKHLLSILLTALVLDQSDGGSFNNKPTTVEITKYHDSDINIWTIDATCTVTDSCSTYTCQYYWGWGGWNGWAYQQFCRTVATYYACNKNVRCDVCQVTTNSAFYYKDKAIFKRACKVDRSGYCLDFETTTKIGVGCWHSGYRLGNGEITTTLQVFTRLDCGDPPIEGYAFGELISTTDGLSINILSCANGYAGTPSDNVITCRSNGSWDNLSGCTKVGCGYPSKAGYKFSTPENTTVGSHVDVDSCEQGYSGTPAPSRITCLGNKTWSGVTGCNILTCPPLSVPEKASLTSTEVMYGTTVLVHCDIGYVLEGASSLTCTENTTWDNPLPSCISNTSTTTQNSTTQPSNFSQYWTSDLITITNNGTQNVTTEPSAATTIVTHNQTTENSMSTTTSQIRTPESNEPVSSSQQRSTETSIPVTATKNYTMASSWTTLNNGTQNVTTEPSAATTIVTHNQTTEYSMSTTTSQIRTPESNEPASSSQQRSTETSIPVTATKNYTMASSWTTSNVAQNGTTETKSSSTSSIKGGTTGSSIQTTYAPQNSTSESITPIANASQNGTIESSTSTSMSHSQTKASQHNMTVVSQKSEITAAAEKEESTLDPNIKEQTNALSSEKQSTTTPSNRRQKSEAAIINASVFLSIIWAVLVLLCPTE